MNSINNIKRHLKRARDDPTVRKRLMTASAACILLISVSLIRPGSSNGSYIVDSGGELIAIERKNTEIMTEYAMVLTVDDGSGERRKVTIVPGGAAASSDYAASDHERDEKVIRDAEIGSILSEMESSTDARIELPRTLSDGTRLRWEKGSGNDFTWLHLLLLYLILIPVIIAGTGDRESRQMKMASGEMVRSIPRFTNQLLLLLNAGLILSDALNRISRSFALVPENRRGIFENEIIETESRCSKDGIGTAAAISALAAKYNVKELMRIATFMNENEKRGSDIIESLSRESKFLWDERKTSAKEKGKSIDTKMAYPLALLLILLIVITMAPALLSM